MQNVLILSAGRRVELVSAFANELKHALPNAQLLAADANPAMAPACHKAQQALQLPRVTDPSYSDRLLELCQCYGPNPHVTLQLMSLTSIFGENST